MIPLNTANVDEIARKNMEIFNSEIEGMETRIFQMGWENNHGAEVIVAYKGSTYVNAEGNMFSPTTAHWERVVSDCKAAGYYVYRKMNHNGHFGTTEVHAYYVSKAPLTSAQREYMNLMDKWSEPWGPGRDQFRGEPL